MSLAVINFIWIGNSLGDIHAACIRSFVRHGHRVLFHCYEDVVDLPVGVEKHDANKLLPISRMIRVPNGSPAVFCDLLRYEVQAQQLGLYVDCDMYCLQPIEDREYMLGWESDDYINGAVLKLPSGSSALEELLQLKDLKCFVPPWMKRKQQYKYKAMAALGIPVRLENLPWGSVGPKAVTYYLKKYAEDKFAEPIDVYYPLSGHHLSLLLDPGLQLSDIITPRSKMIHLWNGGSLNKMIDRFGVLPDSPMHKLLTA